MFAKKSLLVLGTAFAISAAISLPASAVGGGRNINDDPADVPEPLTIIGSLCVGGGLLAKKLTGKADAAE